MQGTFPKTWAIKGLKGCSIRPCPISLLPSVSLHLPKTVCHIYCCCRLLVRPQLRIQTQISTTYPEILCFSRPLTSKLCNTARLCGSAPGRWNTNCPSLFQTQSQRLLAVATHPRCTTQKGLSARVHVCVCDCKAVCRSVYRLRLCIPASLHVSDHTSLTISKLHKCQFRQIIRLP